MKIIKNHEFDNILISNLVETPEDNESIIEKLARVPPDQVKEILDNIVKTKYPDKGYDALKYDWELWGRQNQLAPITLKDEWSTFLILAGRGFGKMLDVNTPIPTPDGFTNIGDLKIGDAVFDENGNICQVTHVTIPEIPKKAYRVWFSDNTYIDACSEHQWITWTRKDRSSYRKKEGLDKKYFPEDWAKWERKIYDSHQNFKYDLSESRIKTTQHILNTLRYGNRGDLNHCIPNAGSLNIECKNLSIDAYSYGLFLGDGNSQDGHINCSDKDYKAYKKIFDERKIKISDEKKQKTCSTFKIDNFFRQLRLENCIKNKSNILKDFTRCCELHRLEVLQGLLDSDGYCSKSGQIEFSSTNKEIFDFCYDLLISLGQKLAIYTKIGKLYGVEKKLVYILSLTPTRNDLFKLPRKLARINEPSKLTQQVRNHHRMITKIEEIKPSLMRCIQVNSKNSMYLCGRQMIPTHNTKIGAGWVNYLAQNGLAKRIALIGRTAGDVNRIILKGSSGIIESAPEWFKPKHHPAYKELSWPNGVIAQYSSGEEPDALRGPQFDAAWIDEFCFTRNTLILTPDGEVPIVDIKAGDKVLTHNGIQTVVCSRSTGKNMVYTVHFSDDSILTGTFNHPISTRKYGWLKLGMLRKGDLVNTFNGTAFVKRIESEFFPRETFNIEVENSHTYYANGILVHNCSLRYLEETMDMLKMGLRLGKKPQLLITTTPRPIPELIKLIQHKKTYTIIGSTFENKSNLAEDFIKDIEEDYAGTTLGQQELYGRIISDDKNAVWTRELIEKCRLKKDDLVPNMVMFYVAIDPAVTANKRSAETGITVVGLGVDGNYYIVYSEGFKYEGDKNNTDRWVEKALSLFDQYNASMIVAEVNNGGDLVRKAIETARPLAPIYEVRASHGKIPRAMLILTLYERGKVKHVGYFDKLEQQMCNLNLMDTKNKLLDVVDSMVWGVTALMEKNIIKRDGNFEVAVGGYRNKIINYKVY